MRLIATDFDGTLNHDGIDETKVDAIRKWRQSGNKFGIVSGRGPEFLTKLNDMLEKEFDFFISCNGSYATDNKGNLLFKEYCECIDVRGFVTDLFEWGATMVHIYYGDKFLRVVPDTSYEEYDYILKEMPAITSFYKISTVLEDFENAERIANEVKDRYGTLANPLLNRRWLDVVPAGVDKAEGIRHLCNVLGIDNGNVIVIGDAMNDMTMIKDFRSYAMECGDIRLKESAMYVVKSIKDLIMRELE